MITATFDGAEREFDIPREFVPYLEKSMGRGIYATLQTFIEGAWTFDDVAAVVSFALYGPHKADRQTFATAKMARKYGIPIQFDYAYRPHPDVVSVLERDGHGNYAGLAADILSDAVFGPVAEPEVVDDAA